MKSYFRFTIMSALLAFVFTGFAVNDARAQVVNEVLKRMDEHYKVLKSLQADVKREQFNFQLKETDEYKGSISMVPGKGRNFSLRLDWTKPRNESISVVNGQYIAYNPSLGQAYTGDSGSKTLSNKGGDALKIMSMSREEIKTNYNVEYLGQESVSGGTPTWHLKLTPKAKTNFKFANLWVDGNGMPIQGKITLLNDDSDTILLSNLKKNESLNGSVFKLSIPKNTKIIKG